jgi:hypothetical protein
MLPTSQIEELIESTYAKEYFVWQMDPTNTDLEAFFNEHVLPDLDERILALCLEESMSYSKAEAAIEREWKVLAAEEADSAAREYAEGYCDMALSEVPAYLQEYFDINSYFDDLMSDRGNLLSPNGGCEYNQLVNGTTYYLYKQ